MFRYVGNFHGFYPKDDPLAAFHVDDMVDAYGDVIGKVYTPFFAPEDKREAMYPDIFEKHLPKFLNYVDANCAKGQFICGDKLTIADFCIGGMYTNFFANPAVGFAAEKWTAVLEQFPNFKAYGERFVAAMNEKHLSKRPVAPI